jgi:hypothetical protein
MELQQMSEPGGGSAAQQTLGAPPPPPSPLSGCYLLIVIGEPHSPEHKEIILQRIAKGRANGCNVGYVAVNVRRVEHLMKNKHVCSQWLFSDYDGNLSA